MRPRDRLLLAFAVTLFAAATWTNTARADRVDAFGALGKTVPVSVESVGDVATAAFLLQDGPGKKLVVSVKAAKKSALVPDVRLVAPDGTVFDAAALLPYGGKIKTTAKSVTTTLPNVPEGYGGLWRVEVRGGADSTGAATVKVKAKDATVVNETLTVPAGASVTKEIDVGSNQALTLKLSRGARNVTIVPRVQVLDPNGVPLGGGFLGAANTSKGTLVLKPYRLPVYGRYRLVLSGENGGGGAVKIVAKTTPAKPVKGAPVADPGAATGAEPATTLTLNGNASHGSGSGPLAFAWSQVAGTPVTLAGGTTAMPSFTVPASGPPLGFELAVLQNGIWSAPVPVSVEIGQRPLADAGRSRAVAASAAVTLDGTGSLDRRGNGLRYLWSQDPTDAAQVTLTGADTPAPSFTAPATPALLRFRLLVDDGALTSFVHPELDGASDEVLVRVGDPAQTTPDAGREQFVPRMATVHLCALATIPASGLLDVPIQWAQVGGPPVTVQDANTPFASFQAPKQSADLIFRLTAGDATDDVWVHVRPAEPNLPPLTIGNGVLQAVSGAVTLNATASIGPEAGSSLSFRWAQLEGPALAPAAPDAGSTTIDLPAGNETRTYAVQANDRLAYGPPDVVRVRNTGYTGEPYALAGIDQTVAPGTLVNLDGRASFRTTGTGPLATWRWRQVSSVDWFDVDAQIGSFDPTAALATFTLPTDVSSITTRRTMTFELIVNDGVQDSAPDYVTITFINLPQNGKPQAVASATPSNPIAGQLVTLQATVTDREGDPTTVRWSQTLGSPLTLSSTTAVNPTFTAPASGTYRFQVIANDGFEDGPASSVTIAVDAAPTALPRITQPGGSGSGLTVDGTGSSDPAGQALTYTWSQVSGPAVAELAANVSSASWAIQSEPAASITLRLVVNDGRQNSAPVNATFVVGTPITVAPTASASSAAYSTTVTLNANVTGAATSIQWRQLTAADGAQYASDPSVGTITGSGSAAASFVVPKPTGSGTSRFGGTQSSLPGATFQVTASNAANSDTKTVRVTFFSSFNATGLGSGNTVYSIIQQSCFGGSCHGGTTNVCSGGAFGMGTATAFRNNTIGVTNCSGSKQRVNSGSASNSYLIDRLKGTATPQMPSGGSLSSAQIGLIEDWIDQGAQNN